MELILKENVPGLGYKDDIVEVKNGYGRNYLIPQGKAVIASPSAKKVLAENLKQRAHKLAKIKAEAEAQAAKINGVKVSVVVKTSENGKIFGSVTTAQIAEQLEKQGVSVDRKIISLNSAIKELGSYKATVRLHKEVAAEIDVDVVAEA